MLQSLADREAYEPNTAALADRRLQDNLGDVSDAHHPGQSSEESESEKEHVNIVYSTKDNASI